MRRMIAVLLLVGMWLLAAPNGGAHQTLIPATVTLGFPDNDNDTGPDAVSGVVDSPKATCESGRKVSIYWIGNATNPETSLLLIAKVRTNSAGEFEGGDVEPIGRGGRVVIARKDVGTNGHRHICAKVIETYD